MQCGKEHDCSSLNGPVYLQASGFSSSGTQEPSSGPCVLTHHGYEVLEADVASRHGVVESSAAFLLKPITPRALLRKVREVLDAKRAA